MRRLAALAVLSLGLAAWACPDETRWAIESEIMRSVEATRTENISAYMEGVPPDLRVRQDDGSVLDRDLLRQEVLRQWALVERTHLIEISIDRLERNRDGSYAVWTTERWDRTTIAADGSRHRVLTLRTRREAWRRRGARWFAYDIDEVGGETWIDGVRQA